MTQNQAIVHVEQEGKNRVLWILEGCVMYHDRNCFLIRTKWFIEQICHNVDHPHDPMGMATYHACILSCYTMRYNSKLSFFPL